MKQLVCEGRCNNSAVVDLDKAIRLFGRVCATVPGKETSAAPRRLLDTARRWVYTGHVESTMNRYACVECGAERAYGDEVVPTPEAMPVGAEQVA
jgi:hypothetical protein